MRDWQEGKRFMARAAGGVTAPHEGLGGRGRVHPRPVLPVTALHKGLRGGRRCGALRNRRRDCTHEGLGVRWARPDHGVRVGDCTLVRGWEEMADTVLMPQAV